MQWHLDVFYNNLALPFKSLGTVLFFKKCLMLSEDACICSKNCDIVNIITIIASLVNKSINTEKKLKKLKPSNTLGHCACYEVNKWVKRKLFNKRGNQKLAYLVKLEHFSPNKNKWCVKLGNVACFFPLFFPWPRVHSQPVLLCVRVNISFSLRWPVSTLMLAKWQHQSLVSCQRWSVGVKTGTCQDESHLFLCAFTSDSETDTGSPQRDCYQIPSYSLQSTCPDAEVPVSRMTSSTAVSVCHLCETFGPVVC